MLHLLYPKAVHCTTNLLLKIYIFLSQFGLESALEQESGVNVIYGCHPHFADTLDLPNKLVLEDLLERANVVGLGEIGLDHSLKNSVDRDVQKRAFRMQLRMAIQRKLPICLHIREATEEGFKVLEEVSSGWVEGGGEGNVGRDETK